MPTNKAVDAVPVAAAASRRSVWPHAGTCRVLRFAPETEVGWMREVTWFAHDDGRIFAETRTASWNDMDAQQIRTAPPTLEEFDRAWQASGDDEKKV